MKTEKFYSFLRFVVGSSLALVTYYTTLYISTEYLSIWYLASSCLAGGTSFVINFTLQKYWTFRNHEIKAVPKQLAYYFLVKLVLFVINTALLFYLVEQVHIGYLMASLVLAVLYSIVSYYLTHKIFGK